MSAGDLDLAQAPAHLREEIERLQRELAGLLTDMGKSQNELLNTVADLRAQLAEANGTIAELQGVVAEGDRQLAEREREVEGLREVIASAVHDLRQPTFKPITAKNKLLRALENDDG